MPTALITGGTAGIGYEFAQQLAAQRYDLILVARDVERLTSVSEGIAAKHGVAVETIAADLIDPVQVAVVEKRLADGSRPVDLLVNNAGYGLKGRFLTNTVDTENGMLDVLVVAVLRLTHAALGPMTERGSGGIINVSSVAGFLPRGTYSAAKAWVNSFSEWAHYEYKPDGVVITALCPGFTKTEFHSRMNVSRSSAPSFMWLEVERLVCEGLADHAKGRAFSIPSKRYQAIVKLSKLVPNALLQRAQSLGRK